MATGSSGNMFLSIESNVRVVRPIVDYHRILKVCISNAYR